MKRAIAFLLAFCAVAMVSNAQNGPVKIWEGTLEIPSYRVDAPETAPSFEREFGYQGARRGIYPYALNDNLTNIKVDTVYRALYLENDYIKVCVLPDIGGRLFNDSPNRNSILHWNNVATHTNNDYQIIFPENTEFGTFHSKRSFLRWPVSDAPYRGEEGFVGQDVSYWRNLPTLKGESVFAYDLQDVNRANEKAALRYALMANEYPENHGYAHLEYYARDAQIYYNIGLAYERVGDVENAEKYYKMATEVSVKDADCVYNYEKGLAMRKLDANADVNPLFEAILSKGKAGVTDYVQNFFGSGARDYPKDVNSRAYYMQGIGHKALGDEAKAQECFKKALSERNDNLWANYYVQPLLSSLEVMP